MRLRPALSLALALACLPATGASAGPAVAERQIGVIGRGKAEIRYDEPSDDFQVCVQGQIPSSSRYAGQWALAVEGTRDAVPFSLPVWTSGSYVVQHCVVLPRASSFGDLTVDFTYTGAGTYVLVHSVHTIFWTPATGNRTAGADIQQ